ncbi:MAG: PD-(D/E)XK nuclease family protein [Eubacterium sp.]|nr:PD-(D/E)XK nuclease family protein [Eubacterium sp.]
MKMINIIKGKSGSGKTTYITDLISEIRNEDRRRKIIVVVPEQYSHSMEKVLIDSSSPDMVKRGLLHTEVLSFTRLSHRITEELGGGNTTVLSEVGRSMLVRHVIDKDGEALHFLGNNAQLAGYVDEIKSFISELMQYNISPDRLQTVIETIKNDSRRAGSLDARLGDILRIYEGFIEYLKEHNLRTADGLISLATERLRSYDEETILDGAYVFFDGFTGFEPLQYEFLRELLKRVEGIYVSITVDTEGLYGRATRRLFKLSIDTETKLLDIADEMGIDVRFISCDQEILPRFKGAPDLMALEASLFRSSIKKYDKVPEHIGLYAIRRPVDEVDFVIDKIKELLRSDEGKKLHYSDIAVIAGDQDNYGIIAKSAFDKAGIPIFVDMGRDFSENPALDYIMSLLNVIRYDFEMKSVMRLIRTGFLIDIKDRTDDVDMLDNFLIASGIRGISLWRKQWNCRIITDKKEAEESLNVLREEVLGMIEPLYNEFKKEHTVKEVNEMLLRFLSDTSGAGSIEKVIEERKDELSGIDEGRISSEMEQIWDKLLLLIDDMNSLLGDSKVDLREYTGLLQSGVNAMTISVIPPQDAVIFGDSGRTRVGNVKYIFFIGVADAFIPRISGGGGIINDQEREYISGIRLPDSGNVKLAGTSLDRIDEDEFHLYMNITKAEKNVFITYPELGFDDKKTNPAYLITRIKSIFPKLREEYVEVKSAKAGKRQALYAEPVLYLEPEIAEKLYTFVDEDGRVRPVGLSISQLETLASCPYKYFMNFGLRLSERKEYSINFADIGDIIHASLDHLVRNMKDEGRDWKDYKEDDNHFHELADKAFDTVITDYRNKKVYSSERNEFLLDRFRGTFKRTIANIKKQMCMGDYTTLGSEMKYYIYEPVSLRGVIDRVDTAEGKKVTFDDEGNPKVEDCTYLRIIDYKTGIHKFSMNDLYYGIQMQMVVYLKAAEEMIKGDHGEGKKLIIPGGMFYYNITDSFRDVSEMKDGEFPPDLPSGKFNDNTGSVKALDNEMVEMQGDIPEGFVPGKKSKAVNLSINKDGELATPDSIMSEKELADLIRYSSFKIGKLAEERESGDIRVNPFREFDNGNMIVDACRYCKFSSVCGFDSEKGECNKVFKRDDDFIYKKMLEELGEE